MRFIGFVTLIRVFSTRAFLSEFRRIQSYLPAQQERNVWKKSVCTRPMCTTADYDTNSSIQISRNGNIRAAGETRVASKCQVHQVEPFGNKGRDRKILMRKLLAYDNGEFDNVQTTHKLDTIVKLEMHMVEERISELREELSAWGHCTEMFGKRHNNAIEGMIQSISQTFGGEELYPTVETKAAQLLYSVLKGHPFFDGNKRISVMLFLKFLEMNQYLVDEDGECVLDNCLLLSLVISIAKSKAEEQEEVIQNIVDTLVRESSNV